MSCLQFRIWDYDDNKMLYFDAPYDIEHPYTDLSRSITDQERIYHKTSNIMQAIGLKDKNGKLIYEDDVLKVIYPFSTILSTFRGKVKYERNQCYYQIENDGAFANFLDTSAIYEIVGNIYNEKEEV